MRWQRILAGALVVLGVPLGIFLTVELVVQTGSSVDRRVVVSNKNELIETGKSQNATPEGTDIGGARMLDPQGDVELARRVIAEMVQSGIPQVALSREVVGGELPCLGFGGTTSLEMRPTDTFGLVVLRGNVRQLFPGEPVPPPPGPPPYVAYLYDERYKGISGQAPPWWGSLRATFGSPNWPKDCPMYMSSDGQASVDELDEEFQWPIYRDFKVQDVHVAQTLSGWTLTVERIQTLGDSIMIEYSVVAPHPRGRFTIEQTLLKVGGKELSSGSGKETLGTDVEVAAFKGLPESSQP